MLCLVSTFIFDLNNHNFSWMAFQERDFDKAMSFFVKNKLSHIGPEISGGGYLPGPFLTLIHLIPAYFFKDPIGFFFLLQICYFINLGITFFLIKKHYNSTLAWLSFFVILISPSVYMYTFSAWHTALVPTFLLLSFISIDQAITKNNNYLYLVTGILYGILIQIHGSSFLFIFLSILFLLALIIKKIQKPNIFTFLIIGFSFTFIYYIIIDFSLDFKNTTYLLNKIGSVKSVNNSNYMNIFDFLNIYFSRATLGYHAFQDFFREAVNGSTYFCILIVISLLKGLFLIIGLISLIINKNNRLINLFQIAFILTPFYFLRTEARWFMMIHPFFEIIISYGLLKSIIFFKDYFFRKYNFNLKGSINFFIIIFIPIIIFSTNTMKKNLFLDEQKIIPSDNLHHSSFSIYYNPYKNHKKIKDFLINELKLTPEDYENKFHFFRGDRNWIFTSLYQLPSWAHYRFAFKNKNIKKALDLKGKGLIVAPIKFRNNIDLKNLDIVKIKEYSDFFVITYRGEYYYKTIPLYSNLKKEEIILNDLNKDKIDLSINNDFIKIKYFCLIKTHYKSPIRFVNELSLKNSASGIRGFFEINGPSIRQASFGRLAPHFIKNPKVILQFENNNSRVIELFDKNLYNFQEGKVKWDGIKYYGNNHLTKHLGSLFHDAPYGIEIKLENLNVNSLKKVIFKIDGYGDYMNSHTEKQKKTINMSREFTINLKEK